MPAYFDCNATAPLDHDARQLVLHYLEVEYGNAGSRTHEFGSRAKRAVQEARQKVASVVSATPEEVVFTSGATESNNLAILGLARHGEAVGRKHIVSTAIEHKAVLEPLDTLRDRGFEVSLVPPTAGGWVDPAAIAAACRQDTLLVSVMHVNNETGIVQPLNEIADAISASGIVFHVDAAQGFGKEIAPIKDKRIQLISISGHKIYGPKGVGALVVRRTNGSTVPLQPLMFGGGQERGLRPGTLPVALIVGLGAAADAALRNHAERRRRCLEIRERVLSTFGSVGAVINGDVARSVPHTVNLSIPGLDSEAIMVALKDVIAVSNGSACTSHSYEPSHVLTAMGLDTERVQGAIRLSWSHMSEEPDWNAVNGRLRLLL